MVFHLAPFRPAEELPDGVLSGLASGGHAAVVFFFVLSGFVLGYAHAGDTERSGCDVAAPTFWRLRFARVAPAYYLALVLALPILAQVIAQSQAAGWSLATGVMMVLLMVQAWWPAYAGLWNFPAWSLSVECVFYALFPGLARALALWSAWAVLVAAYALVFAVGAWRTELPSFAVSSLFPLLHLPLFIVGMALARLYLFGPALSPKTHAAMLRIGACLLVLIFGGAWLLPAWTRGSAMLVPIFALVVLGAAGAASVMPGLTRPAFMALGEASYAIYILHIPLRYIWETTLGALLGVVLWPWLDFLLYFAFVVLVSVVTFRQVETPLRRWIAGERARRSANRGRPTFGRAVSGAGG